MEDLSQVNTQHIMGVTMGDLPQVYTQYVMGTKSVGPFWSQFLETVEPEVKLWCLRLQAISGGTVWPSGLRRPVR